MAGNPDFLMKGFAMKNIVEYRLETPYPEYSDSSTTIETHNNAEILEVKSINGHLAVWLREDPNEPAAEYAFWVIDVPFKDGHTVEEISDRYNYVGLVQHGARIYHVLYMN